MTIQQIKQDLNNITRMRACFSLASRLKGVYRRTKNPIKKEQYRIAQQKAFEEGMKYWLDDYRYIPKDKQLKLIN